MRAVFRRSLLGGCTVLAMVGAAAASAQDAAPPPQATGPVPPAQTEQAEKPQATGGGDILVTGSRIARNGFDASTPVSVVSNTDIKLSGNVNIERTLAQLPQEVGSYLGNAFSNTVPGGIADVNLRGLGAQRNLVLVNGRRFAIYGPEQVVDLNTIPASLIARTEIVTDGSLPGSTP